jgi:hypothetical protein
MPHTGGPGTGIQFRQLPDDRAALIDPVGEE